MDAPLEDGNSLEPSSYSLNVQMNEAAPLVTQDEDVKLITSYIAEEGKPGVVITSKRSTSDDYYCIFTSILCVTS